MPKAVLGTGAGTVGEKVTILKTFKVETGREKQAVTVQSKTGGKQGLTSKKAAHLSPT